MPKKVQNEEVDTNTESDLNINQTPTSIEEPLPKIEEPLPKIEELPELKDENFMGLGEFTSSLKGTDLLLASAMRKEFMGRKLSKTEWIKALKEFANREA